MKKSLFFITAGLMSLVYSLNTQAEINDPVWDVKIISITATQKVALNNVLLDKETEGKINKEIEVNKRLIAPYDSSPGSQDAKSIIGQAFCGKAIVIEKSSWTPFEIKTQYTHHVSGAQGMVQGTREYTTSVSCAPMGINGRTKE